MLPFICINDDRHLPCKLIKIARLLDCIDRGLTEVPFYKNGTIVRVLDLRKKNLSKIDENILVTYPNLALVDVRQNPKICGNINVENVIVKSDCPPIQFSPSAEIPTSHHSPLQLRKPPFPPNIPNLHHQPLSHPKTPQYQHRTYQHGFWPLRTLPFRKPPFPRIV